MLTQIEIISFLKAHFDYDDCLKLQMTNLEFRSGNIALYEMFCLCSIIYYHEPQLIVEFGTFNGRTTINMAHNMPENGRIVTVDLPKGTKPKFDLANGKNENNDELGYVGLPEKLFNKHVYFKSGKIKQIWSDTANINPQDGQVKDADLIFIDASHTEANCYNDSLTAFKMVRNYGFIIWHDYNGWPGVTAALDRFEQDFKNKITMYQIKDTSLAVGWVLEK